MNTKKIISFVLPQTIVQGTTALGQKYEVNFENGLKVLNSENSNYSYGSLHQIMQKGIDEVLKVSKPETILMLGLGAGSALSVLKNKCNWNYHVKVVEIDKDLIDIAKTHFELENFENVEVVHGDAFKHIENLPTASYDLILDDIFWDDSIPAFCLERKYLDRLNCLLTDKGIYMRNTMSLDTEARKQFEIGLSQAFSGHYSVKHPVYGNKIYFCQHKPTK